MVRAKKVLLLIFIISFILIILSLQITVLCIYSAHIPRTTYTNYSDLQNVLGNKIVYISEEFCDENNLSPKSIYSGIILGKPVGEIVGEVEINYNAKVGMDESDYKNIADNLGSCIYSFCSKEDDGKIPVEIKVFITLGKSKNAEYSLEYGGYEYSKSQMSINVISYNVLAYPNKRSKCNMNLEISIKQEVQDIYTQEQKNVRMEKLFKSAVENIVLY